MKYTFLLLSIILLSTSCKQGTEKQVNDLPKEPAMVEIPAGAGSSLPYLVTGADGNLYFSWVEKSDDTAVFKFSRMSDDSWTVPEIIASGTDWFVNWADYPMISVNSKGDMLAHFLAKSSAGTYSYDVNVMYKSSDKWEGPVIPHNDGTPTEHGFVSMLPLTDDNFQLAWLDGRNTGESPDGGHRGAMTVRSAVISPDGELTEQTELDGRVCDCCQTAAALTADGPIVFYRDRSEMEIRDMSFVRKVNDSWSEPSNLHADMWEIAACPVNGPRADANGKTVVVSWFSAPNGIPQVKASFSFDGGESFIDPVMVDGFNPMGRVDVVLINEDEAMVSWLGRKDDKTAIKARKVFSDGSTGPEIIIAETSESRGSGFPQMELWNGKLYFAFTLLEGEEQSIQLVSIDS